jgi:hypothetical protein
MFRFGIVCLAVLCGCGVHASAEREGFACNAGFSCENGLTCVAGICIKAPATTLSCAALGGGVCSATQLCTQALLSTPDVSVCCPDDGCLDTTQALLAQAPHARMPPPVIDGDPSEWDGATRIPLTKVDGPAPTSPADFSAQYAVRWDDTALYVLLEVTDDVWNPAGSSAAWEDDIGELFIDMDPRHPKVDWDASEDQFDLLQNNTAREGTVHPRNWDAKAAYVHLANNHWRIEASVNWPSAFPKPRAGAVIGFDVAADDDDGAASDNLRIRQLNWNNNGTLSSDARFFGLLQLTADTAEASFSICGDGACEGDELCPRCGVDCGACPP